MTTRKVALLAVTHLLAFGLPFAIAGPFMRGAARNMTTVSAMMSESYSRRIASLQVAAGDDAVGAAALRRHLERLSTLRQQLVASGEGPDYLPNIMDDGQSRTLAEIAFLLGHQGGDSPDAVAAQALSGFRQTCTVCRTDTSEVLRIGAWAACVDRGGPQ